MKITYNKSLLNTDQFATVTKLSHIIRKLPQEFSLQPKDLVVGGFVRDLLVDGKASDIDVEVYGVSAKTLDTVLRSYFSKSKIIQLPNFGLWNITHEGHGYTYSLPRTEKKAAIGHRGFIVHTEPNLTKNKALLRRDFTINALLLDPVTETIYDYMGGVSDVQQRVLRAINKESLFEDPVRVWRAIQLVARFTLTVEQTTEQVLRTMARTEEMRLLSGTRIRMELDKLFGKSEKPSRGLALIRKWKLLPLHLPEIASKAADKKWWNEFTHHINALSDRYEHTQLRARWQYVLRCLPISEQQSLISRLSIPKKFR